MAATLVPRVGPSKACDTPMRRVVHGVVGKQQPNTHQHTRKGKQRGNTNQKLHCSDQKKSKRLSCCAPSHHVLYTHIHPTNVVCVCVCTKEKRKEVFPLLQEKRSFLSFLGQRTKKKTLCVEQNNHAVFGFFWHRTVGRKNQTTSAKLIQRPCDHSSTFRKKKKPFVYRSYVNGKTKTYKRNVAVPARERARETEKRKRKREREIPPSPSPFSLRVSVSPCGTTKKTNKHQEQKKQTWISHTLQITFCRRDLVDSASSHMLVSRTKPCTPQNHCICRNLRMAHYIRRNLPQKCCGFGRIIGYLGETPS